MDKKLVDNKKQFFKGGLKAALYGSLLLLECAVWGYSNAFSKLGLEAITPVWALAIRYAASSALFAIFFGKRIKQRYNKSDLKPCLIVSLATAAAFILGFVALDNSSATNCAFLMSLSVVFTPFLSIPLQKAKFRPLSLIPVGIVAVGTFLICGGRLDAFSIGDVLGILCSLATSMMLIFSNKYLSGADIDPFVLCFIQCVVCFVVCLPLALAFEPVPDFMHIEPIGWYMIALLSIGGTFLAYICQNTAMRHVSSTFGALAFCTEPVFTAISAFFLLGETLAPIAALGAVLIMISVVLATVFESTPQK